MTFIRKSVELFQGDWATLDEIAFEVGARAAVGPTAGATGWRALIRLIAQGKLVVVTREQYDGSRVKDQSAAVSDLLAALEDVELRTTQGRIASTIGKRSGQQQADFLRGELERIAAVTRAAIAKAQEAQYGREVD